MLHTMTTLSALSRISSSSYSFQPTSDSSTRISVVGLMSSPSWAMVRNSSSVLAMPPPVPPRVKLGRMMMG